MRRLTPVIALLAALVAVSPVSAEPSAQSLPIGAIIALVGTPHLWVAGEDSLLHWAGDTRALAGKRVDWGNRREVSLDELKRLPRGAPWLSAGLVKSGDPIYFVKWESSQARPALLHIRSIADVELFGIDGSNYGQLVLDQASWEQRFGFRSAELEKGVLASASRTSSPPPCLPTVERWQGGYGGSVTATVRNTCSEKRHFGLNLVIYDRKDGQPVATTNTAYWEAVPGDVRQVTIPGSALGGTWAVYLRNSGPPGDTSPLVCEPVPGTASCIETDQWLRGAIWALGSVDVGRDLLKAAAEAGVVLRRERTPVGSLGSYSPSKRTITIDTRLDAYGDWERATVLAHELKHAADHAAGKLGTAMACFGNEEDAFRVQAQVWSSLWKNRLPAEQNGAHEELNGIALTVNRDPLRFVATLMQTYKHQCS